MILAGVIDEHGRRVGFGRAFNEILVEEWEQDIAPELKRCVTFPVQWAKHGALIIYLAVTPGAHHEIVLIVGGVFRF